MDSLTESEFRRVWKALRCKANCSSVLTCDGIDECLGISDSGSATLFLNEQGDWVAPSGGISSLAAIGATPNANGATITGTVLNLQPADATFGGAITATTQSIVGAKTFTTSATSPLLAGTTSTTTPLIIGGSGTTQTITYKTTTGVGATGADHIFTVGTNGATEALRIFNSGFTGIPTKGLVIGSNTPNLNEPAGNFPAQLELVSNAGAYQAFNMKAYGAVSTQNDMHFYRYGGSEATPSATTSGMLLSSWGWRGWGSTAATESAVAFIVDAANTWTDASTGANLRIETTPIGSNQSTGRKQVFRADNSGSAIIGTATTLTSTELLSVQRNANSALISTISNSTSGTTSRATMQVLTSDHEFDMHAFSAGWTTTNYAKASGDALVSNGTAGISIAAFSGDLRFYTGGSTDATHLRLTMSSTGVFTYLDATNFAFSTSTGSKIGTGNTQKIGFWNAAPIAQPTTAIAASTFAANTSGIVNDTATFDGYTIGQVVKSLRNAGLLA